MALKRTTWRGRTFDTRTVAMLVAAEKLLRTWTGNKKLTLTVFQGSYNGGGVAASAGTHDGSGAADVWSTQAPHALVVKALRTVGFAAWYRAELWKNGKRVWGTHIHAIAIGSSELSAGARTQVAAYYRGENGLADHGRDGDVRLPVIRTFEQWKASLKKAPKPAKPAKAPKPAKATKTVKVKTATSAAALATAVGVTVTQLLGLNPGLATQTATKGGPVAIHGVDLSHWQSGALDFAAAKKAGVRFVYHKATESTSYTDPLYARRRTEVAKAGLVFGAYGFARPGVSTAAVQAKHFVLVAKPKAGDMLPALDLEDRGGLSDAQLTVWAAQWVSTVKRITGFDSIVYTPFDLGPAVTSKSPLWVARYNNSMAAPNVPGSWTGYSIWQFSNGVFGSPSTVPGLGHVDINTLAGEPDLALTSLRIGAPIKPGVTVTVPATPTSTSTPKPAPSPTPAVTKPVTLKPGRYVLPGGSRIRVGPVPAKAGLVALKPGTYTLPGAGRLVVK